jgi:hypothetical protein
MNSGRRSRRRRPTGKPKNRWEEVWKDATRLLNMKTGAQPQEMAMSGARKAPSGAYPEYIIWGGGGAYPEVICIMFDFKTCYKITIIKT